MGQKMSGNPWLSIWTAPRHTIRKIITTDPKYGFLLLSAVYGLPIAFNLAQNLSVTAMLPLWAIVVGSLILCTFIGMIGISITAWLLQVTGRWINGKGKFQTVRAAVTWAQVPNFVTILMWAILLGVFGSQVMGKEFTQTQFNGFQAGIVFLVFLVQTIISIWSFIILLKALGEVQGFSAWKALLNVLIPFVIVVAVIWFVGWALWGMGATGAMGETAAAAATATIT
jgi:hypothetical protein